MSLNKSTGNMYNWINYTFNTIKGECYHDCSYCYMKRWGSLKPVRFDENEMKTDLGTGNAIFVGSSNDLFAQNLPTEWILKTLEKCRKHDTNTYVFQTKNPKRLYSEFMDYLPTNTVIGTTIESDIQYNDIQRNSPPVKERAFYLREIGSIVKETFVTVEPILAFNFADLVRILYHSGAKTINIGADSGNNKMPEPTKQEIVKLIEEVSKFAIVQQKSNLKRLLK